MRAIASKRKITPDFTVLNKKIEFFFKKVFIILSKLPKKKRASARKLIALAHKLRLIPVNPKKDWEWRKSRKYGYKF